MSFKTRWLGAAAIAGLAFSAAVTTTVAPAMAADAAAAPVKCASNPFVGTWRLNKAKSHVTRNNGVIAGRIVIVAPLGEDGLTYVFIDDDDKRLSGREETWFIQFDDKPRATTGGDPRLLSFKHADCNSFDMVTRRQLIFNPDGSVKQYIPEGQIQSRSHHEVSPDGKTMTSTGTGILGNQSSYQGEVLVYDRL